MVDTIIHLNASDKVKDTTQVMMSVHSIHTVQNLEKVI